MTINNSSCEFQAYALGYYHGRVVGFDRGCFSEEADTLRHLYQSGYEAGVGDYCREFHKED